MSKGENKSNSLRLKSSERKKYDAGKFEAFPDERRTAELSWPFPIEMQIAGTVLHKALFRKNPFQRSNIQILIIQKCDLSEVQKDMQRKKQRNLKGILHFCHCAIIRAGSQPLASALNAP